MAYKVITTFFDDGRVEASGIIEVPERLENRYSENDGFDEYVDYFDTEEEARNHVNDALSI